MIKMVPAAFQPAGSRLNCHSSPASPPIVMAAFAASRKSWIEVGSLTTRNILLLWKADSRSPVTEVSDSCFWVTLIWPSTIWLHSVLLPPGT